jgi:YD repeat-containing protein
MARLSWIPAAFLAALALTPAPSAAQNDSPVWTLVQAAGTSEDNGGADAVVVFDSLLVDVEETGLSHRYQHRLLKVLTEDGARDQTVLRFDYDPASNMVEVRRALVHRSGGVEEVDLSAISDLFAPAHMIYWGGRMKLLPVPRLDVGDAVEVWTYKKGFQIAYLEGSGPDERYIPPMRGHFYDVVLFRENLPMKEKVYELRVLREKPVQYSTYNGEVHASMVFEGDTHLRYAWWLEDAPAFEPEPRSPDASDIIPKVVMATVGTWEEKSKWFYAANETVFTVTPEIQDEVDRLTRGLRTDEERVAACLHWAAQKIRYSGLSMGPGEGYTIHPSTMIYNDRCGVCKDIAGMGLTLLKAAGYEVYPAMTMAGARVERIPADQFNHCVVARRRADGTYEMVDPTWAVFDMPIWSRAEGEQNFEIGTPWGENLMITPSFTAEENRLTVDSRTTLLPDGTMEGVLTLTGKNYSDARLRRDFAYRARSEWTDLLAGWLGGLSPELEVVGLTFTTLDDFSRPLVVTARWRAPGAAVLYDGGGFFRAPGAQFLKNAGREVRAVGAATLETREQPLLLWNPVEVESHETIQLPPGYRLAAAVEPVDAGGDVASFRMHGEESKGKVSLSENLRVAQRTLEPGDYGELYESVTALKDFASAGIRLTK